MAPRTLDVQQLMRDGGTLAGSSSYDFSARDFHEFAMSGPVSFHWEAHSTGAAVRLDFTLEAGYEAACVRCLEPFTGQLLVEKSYDILPEELVGEYPEYPTSRDGEIDLEEFAYGEVVLEAPIVQVCREDCPGLCPACGRPVVECACGASTAQEAEASPAPDPRWQALRDLLDDGSNEA
ncbi:YceD family protein [Ruminococcaceae bacterium OttesenSCG-928-D13]|nr:YceD family protein [Ruminococcaceae bacterium OttesenSCG-928-D13]